MKVTELAPKMPEIHPYLAILTLSFCFLYYLTTEAIDRLPKSWWSKTAYVIGQKQPAKTTSVECPYSYIRQIYGKHHWAAFVRKLSPNLKQNDPIKYEIVNEIMDAMHLCLMLVDDISDGSDYRKGHLAAHKIYGPSETANRAYYRLTQLLKKTTVDFPHLAPWLMQDLEDILEGQDMSLVWRRDGLSSFPIKALEREAAYKRMVSLKTGSLFRLLGHLVLEDRSMDDTFTQIAWYSQVQNDCKNVYSSEYVKLKGSLAEDLRNKEITYPIVLALGVADGRSVAKALDYPSTRNMRQALQVIQGETVREMCMGELKRSSSGIEDWLQMWARKEKLDLKA